MCSHLCSLSSPFLSPENMNHPTLTPGQQLALLDLRPTPPLVPLARPGLPAGGSD